MPPLGGVSSPVAGPVARALPASQVSVSAGQTALAPGVLDTVRPYLPSSLLNVLAWLAGVSPLQAMIPSSDPLPGSNLARARRDAGLPRFDGPPKAGTGLDATGEMVVFADGNMLKIVAFGAGGTITVTAPSASAITAPVSSFNSDSRTGMTVFKQDGGVKACIYTIPEGATGLSTPARFIDLPSTATAYSPKLLKDGSFLLTYVTPDGIFSQKYASNGSAVGSVLTLDTGVISVFSVYEDSPSQTSILWTADGYRKGTQLSILPSGELLIPDSTNLFIAPRTNSASNGFVASSVFGTTDIFIQPISGNSSLTVSAPLAGVTLHSFTIVDSVLNCIYVETSSVDGSPSTTFFLQQHALSDSLSDPTGVSVASRSPVRLDADSVTNLALTRSPEGALVLKTANNVGGGRLEVGLALSELDPLHVVSLVDTFFQDQTVAQVPSNGTHALFIYTTGTGPNNYMVMQVPLVPNTPNSPTTPPTPADSSAASPMGTLIGAAVAGLGIFVVAGVVFTRVKESQAKSAMVPDRDFSTGHPTLDNPPAVDGLTLEAHLENLNLARTNRETDTPLTANQQTFFTHPSTADGEHADIVAFSGSARFLATSPTQLTLNRFEASHLDLADNLAHPTAFDLNHVEINIPGRDRPVRCKYYPSDVEGATGRWVLVSDRDLAGVLLPRPYHLMTSFDSLEALDTHLTETLGLTVTSYKVVYKENLDRSSALQETRASEVQNSRLASIQTMVFDQVSRFASVTTADGDSSFDFTTPQAIAQNMKAMTDLIRGVLQALNAPGYLPSENQSAVLKDLLTPNTPLLRLFESFTTLFSPTFTSSTQRSVTTLTPQMPQTSQDAFALRQTPQIRQLLNQLSVLIQFVENLSEGIPTTAVSCAQDAHSLPSLSTKNHLLFIDFKEQLPGALAVLEYISTEITQLSGEGNFEESPAVTTWARNVVTHEGNEASRQVQAARITTLAKAVADAYKNPAAFAQLSPAEQIKCYEAMLQFKQGIAPYFESEDQYARAVSQTITRAITAANASIPEALKSLSVDALQARIKVLKDNIGVRIATLGGLQASMVTFLDSQQGIPVPTFPDQADRNRNPAGISNGTPSVRLIPPPRYRDISCNPAPLFPNISANPITDNTEKGNLVLSEGPFTNNFAGFCRDVLPKLFGKPHRLVSVGCAQEQDSNGMFKEKYYNYMGQLCLNPTVQDVKDRVFVFVDYRKSDVDIQAAIDAQAATLNFTDDHSYQNLLRSGLNQVLKSSFETACAKFQEQGITLNRIAVTPSAQISTSVYHVTITITDAQGRPQTLNSVCLPTIPDHTAPDLTDTSYRDLVMELFCLATTPLLVTEPPLIVVHCSAGVGRSATILGPVKAMMEGYLEREYSAQELVDHFLSDLRAMRYHAIQELDQLKALFSLAFDAMLEILNRANAPARPAKPVKQQDVYGTVTASAPGFVWTLSGDVVEQSVDMPVVAARSATIARRPSRSAHSHQQAWSASNTVTMALNPVYRSAMPNPYEVLDLSDFAESSADGVPPTRRTVDFDALVADRRDARPDRQPTRPKVVRFSDFDGSSSETDED